MEKVKILLILVVGKDAGLCALKNYDEGLRDAYAYSRLFPSRML